tara:strand:+ start:2492 stop:2929 length:438 start_codon:yes stop_codon:yes gene_type:complete
MQPLKKLSRPIIFVPMAADFLHHGHINLLLKAKKYGKVVVGLMTDKGIKSYKKKKPLVTFRNRAKIIKQLKCVDYFIPINGLQYAKFAKFYKFEFFMHGDDWKKNVQSIERKKLKNEMKKWGGKVVEVNYTKNISSSLIKKIIKL